MAKHKITFADIQKAHELFQAKESRDLSYRVATELLMLSLRGHTSFSVGEAVTVLLESWNGAYFRFRPRARAALIARIERLLATHGTALAGYRQRVIDDLDDKEKPAIANLFHAFETVLARVGAAKALHLLAPTFFPLWDRAIAKEYGDGKPLGPAGTNQDRYWRFMVRCRDQCRALRREAKDCPNLLKFLDEYNYCHFTKKWLRPFTL